MVLWITILTWTISILLLFFFGVLLWAIILLEDKPMPNMKEYFVTCPECGAEQPDMGKGVACEECGYGPMPYYNEKRELIEE